MKININKYGYVTSYAKIGGLMNGITVDDVQNPSDYQYIDGGLVYNPIPEDNSGFIKPIYNGTEFLEDATDEEIMDNVIEVYNNELIFAGKAATELQCGIIDTETFLSVSEYMKSIDPYSQNTLKTAKVPRPEIFNKYRN
ncbi:MAG: DUF2977 domain-containing protein [Cetobacterium sp.]